VAGRAQSALVQEKALSKARDRLNAERRELPWVKVEKNYVFDGPNGKETLADLFAGRSQLVVYHFMFASGVPGWRPEVAVGPFSPSPPWSQVGNQGCAACARSNRSRPHYGQPPSRRTTSSILPDLSFRQGQGANRSVGRLPLDEYRRAKFQPPRNPRIAA
jgi:hypothetical protein